MSFSLRTPATFSLVVSSPKFVKINDVLTPVEDNGKLQRDTIFKAIKPQWLLQTLRNLITNDIDTITNQFVDNERKIYIFQWVFNPWCKWKEALLLLAVPSTYEGTNWRRIQLPEMVEVPAEFKKILAKPVVVELDALTGAVAKMVISRNEPEWSVNFKKGIVSLFQVKMESGVGSNLVRWNKSKFLYSSFLNHATCRLRSLPWRLCPTGRSWRRLLLANAWPPTRSTSCQSTSSRKTPLSSHSLIHAQRRSTLRLFALWTSTTVRSRPLSPFTVQVNKNQVLQFCKGSEEAKNSYNANFNMIIATGHFLNKGASDSINNIESMLTRTSTTRYKIFNPVV